MTPAVRCRPQAMSSVDWPLVSKVAAKTAGRYELEGTYHEERFAEQAPGLVERASGLVEDATGLITRGQPVVSVVNRNQWVEANVASFSVLLAPAEDALQQTTGLGSELASRFVALEMGAVLGLLSRRVLGQYELVLPTADGGVGDTVMFVGANILAMERQQEFRPAEFRFWVALHECTHRAQFLGVPWLREYFLSLVAELVGSATPEPGRMQRVYSQLRTASSAGEPMIDERGLFGLFASPDQQGMIDRVQAMMSLLEGHGHVVMDDIGARELVTQQRMSAVLKMRRRDPRTATFMRLIGLEMKLKQYEAGAKFIKGVERHAGWSALDAAWISPEHLPTLEEIDNPVSWLERVQ